MSGDGNETTVRMPVTLVASFRADVNESVGFEGPSDFTGGQATGILKQSPARQGIQRTRSRLQAGFPYLLQ